MLKKLLMTVFFGFSFFNIVASEDQQPLKSILKNRNEKPSVLFATMLKKPSVKIVISPSKIKTRKKFYGISEKKSQNKIVRPDNIFLVKPLLAVATKEEHTPVGVSDLKWILRCLSLSDDRYTPRIYENLEIAMGDAIHDKFGDKALESFRNKQKSWSFDSCTAAMYACCLRMTGFSETTIAHNRCEKTVKNAMAVVDEFKNIKFVGSQEMKRD